MYAVDGMGSAMTATVGGTMVAAQADAIFLVRLLERSDLSYIGTHAGGRPTETHAIKGRIKRLVTAVLNST